MNNPPTPHGNTPTPAPPEAAEANAASPPTQRNATPAKPKGPDWPLPIGIISLVFAAMGIIGGLFELLSVALLDAFATLASTQTPGQTQQANNYAQIYMQVQKDFQIQLIAIYALGILIDILLFTAGIAALKRKPATRALHLAFAASKTVIAIASVGLAFAMNEEIAKRAAAQNIQPTTTGFEPVFMIAGLVWSLAWPTFLAAWFLRPKVTNDCRTLPDTR